MIKTDVVVSILAKKGTTVDFDYNASRQKITEQYDENSSQRFAIDNGTLNFDLMQGSTLSQGMMMFIIADNPGLEMRITASGNTGPNMKLIPNKPSVLFIDELEKVEVSNSSGLTITGKFYATGL